MSWEPNKIYKKRSLKTYQKRPMYPPLTAVQNKESLGEKEKQSALKRKQFQGWGWTWKWPMLPYKLLRSALNQSVTSRVQWIYKYFFFIFLNAYHSTQLFFSTILNSATSRFRHFFNAHGAEGKEHAVNKSTVHKLS